MCEKEKGRYSSDGTPEDLEILALGGVMLVIACVIGFYSGQFQMFFLLGLVLSISGCIGGFIGRRQGFAGVGFFHVVSCAGNWVGHCVFSAQG